MSELRAVYVLWLREMKRYLRSKSRVLGTLLMPLLFLVFFGMGFSEVKISAAVSVPYTPFLVPGLLAMTILFTSISSGISVIWDREFGFLKEVMVAPIRRVSIVLGRLTGGMTISVLQAIALLLFSLLMGFPLPTLPQLLLALVFMLLISATFVGLGLVLASKMRDIHGFNLIIQLVVFPLFFLSGALYPIDRFPSYLLYLSYANPLTYGVDGLRGALINISSFPMAMDFGVLVVSSILMIFLGAWFFGRSDAV